MSREVLKAAHALLKDVDVKRVVFNEVTQQRGARRVPPSARDRPRAGRRLSRAPRARLSRRLHAVAGAVAQAAGQPLGRPRAVGGAAPHLRARSRDRGLQGARILDRRGRVRRPRRATASPPASPHLDGKRLDRFDLDNEAKARAAADAILAAAGFTVASVERKQIRRNPPPPFTTSTLQQEASRKLGFGASRTMRIAQRLYEGVDLDGETVGLITYMRTDGVAIVGRGDRRGAQPDRQRLRRALRARRAARLPQPGEERAGSARGDPPDRSRPAAPAMSRAISTTTSAGSTS